MHDDQTVQQKRHLAAIAVIFDEDGRVLLGQRHNPESTYSHMKWNFPGGGIEFGEHPKDTVTREVKEEIGLDISLLTKHPIVESVYYEDAEVHVVLLAYPAHVVGGTIDVSGDEETHDAQWFHPHEIKYDECLFLTKEIIEQAQKLRKETKN